ncbi:MAG: membrane integrity-associated transporter subunit PqiC [Opitutae bacterium]|nr:membrane integrity-associated transporter subunit PqiC [Opitutae bacterium]
MKKLALCLQLSALCALSSVLGLLSACNLPQPQADTVRHFTLSTPAATPADGAVVRPVQLAGHLRGRPMAVRVAPNEVIYNEDVRWAEPLDDAITQLLRARVGSAGAGRTITVQLSRCELVRAEGNNVQLAATWTITAADGTAQRGAFTAGPRTWDGKDQGALVGLIRDAVNELGDTLAAAVAVK